MSCDPKLLWQLPAITLHSKRLCCSFHHWTGKSLIEMDGSDVEIAQALFEAPFVLVSHGLEIDPILNYGNRAALELWQMSWEQFTSTPSRYTAEPVAREERDRLLAQTNSQGYISNYRGVRITSTGKRFKIEDAIIWNVFDENSQKCGQAATFPKWQFL